MDTQHPNNWFAYFATREAAEAAAAELGEEFLTVVERVERPWALRAARPYTTEEEGADHDMEFTNVTERHDGHEEFAADESISPLSGPRPFRISPEDGEESG